MNISISYYSAKGNRAKNEDAVSLMESQKSILAIVADGLGGHAEGEVASNQAVLTLNTLLRAKEPEEDQLIDAIQQASQDIFAIRNPMDPMHTTIAALWLNDSTAIAANVGDSRIYQFRGNRILYQSVDHSVAQMAVLVGEMDQSEVRTSKDRNKLIRVLGNSAVPKVDCEILHIQEGDRFLICSDGFWEAVTEESMLAAAADTDTAQKWIEVMRRIVERTQNPTQDNHTAVALLINHAI